MRAVGKKEVTRRGRKIRPKDRRKTQISVHSCLRFSQINSVGCPSNVTRAERIQPEENKEERTGCARRRPEIKQRALIRLISTHRCCNGLCCKL